jgi:hypothetical protein
VRPAPEVEQVIVGGIVSRIASELLLGKPGRLSDLAAPFVEYVLAFYRLAEPSPEGRVLALEREGRVSGRALRSSKPPSRRVVPKPPRNSHERCLQNRHFLRNTTCVS